MEKLSEDQIKEIIEQHVANGATLYSVQYQDYSQDEWTVPVMLTEKRADQIISDDSIKTIKLFYNNETIILVL